MKRTMESDVTAILVLATYAIAAGAIVGWQIAHCKHGWQAWLLYATECLYVPLMFRWRANGRCPFPTNGPALIIANHRSPVDPLLIWMNNHLVERGTIDFRVIAFLTAREYCEQPGFVGWVCRHVQCIPTNRDGKDMAATRETLRRLQSGNLVGVFPEGRLNNGPGLLPGNPGVAWLALTAQVPVYPVFIHDSPQGHSMVACFHTRSRVRIVYGEPIDLSEYYGRRTSRELLAEVTDLLMRRLAELGGLTSPEDAADVRLPHPALVRRTG